MLSQQDSFYGFFFWYWYGGVNWIAKYKFGSRPFVNRVKAYFKFLEDKKGNDSQYADPFDAEIEVDKNVW